MLTPTCGTITAPNIEGPFFTAGSPERTDLVEPGAAGTILILSGVVLSPQCEPLAGALVDFWQADDTGAYDNEGFVLRGHQLTDDSGRYQLRTIVPGRYLNGDTFRPRHIHVKVAATGTDVLTTQLYFENDPFAATDPWILDSLVLGVSGEPEDGPAERSSTFDFVLSV